MSNTPWAPPQILVASSYFGWPPQGLSLYRDLWQHLTSHSYCGPLTSCPGAHLLPLSCEMSQDPLGALAYNGQEMLRRLGTVFTNGFWEPADKFFSPSPQDRSFWGATAHVASQKRRDQTVSCTWSWVAAGSWICLLIFSPLLSALLPFPSLQLPRQGCTS